MPLPTQHSLFCILLFWTTIISIIQAVFIILFFTLGHKDLLQNSSITESTPLKHSLIHSTTSPPSKDRLHSCGVKMLTFNAVRGNSTIEWLTNNPNENLIIMTKPTTLTIGKGGYYFLNLQVTLNEYGNPKVKRTVHVRRNKDVILEGWFNTNTNSTGLLGKVELLSTGHRLEVTISPPGSLIFTKSVTHLDIIYLPMSDN